MSLTKEKMENIREKCLQKNPRTMVLELKIVGSPNLNNASYPSSQAAAKISATDGHDQVSQGRLDFFIEQKHINYSRASATQIEHCNRPGVVDENGFIRTEPKST